LGRPGRHFPLEQSKRIPERRGRKWQRRKVVINCLEGAEKGRKTWSEKTGPVPSESHNELREKRRLKIFLPLSPRERNPPKNPQGAFRGRKPSLEKKGYVKDKAKGQKPTEGGDL